MCDSTDVVDAQVLGINEKTSMFGGRTDLSGQRTKVLQERTVFKSLLRTVNALFRPSFCRLPSVCEMFDYDDEDNAATFGSFQRSRPSFSLFCYDRRGVT